MTSQIAAWLMGPIANRRSEVQNDGDVKFVGATPRQDMERMPTGPLPRPVDDPVESDKYFSCDLLVLLNCR